MSLIIGSKYIEEIGELRDMGYDIITFEPSDALQTEISSHADVNAFKINNIITPGTENNADITSVNQFMPIVMGTK
jgi:hypothetical protein